MRAASLLLIAFLLPAGDFYLSLAGAGLFSSYSFSRQKSFTLYQEEASQRDSYSFSSLPSGSASAGYCWDAFCAGLSFSYMQGQLSGQHELQLPHPFYFNKFRSCSYSADYSYSQMDLSLEGRLRLLKGSFSLQLLLSAGYSSARFKEAESFDLNEKYPYDEVSILKVNKKEKEAPGFSAGTGLEAGIRLFRGMDFFMGLSLLYSNLKPEGMPEVKPLFLRGSAGLKFWF